MLPDECSAIDGVWSIEDDLEPGNGDTLLSCRSYRVALIRQLAKHVSHVYCLTRKLSVSRDDLDA